MKRIILFLLFLVYGGAHINAQNAPSYRDQINVANQLYQDKEFLKSAQASSAAFAAHPKQVNVYDRYNAACSWALANRPEEAFEELQIVVSDYAYTNADHFSNDSDLESLHTDARWEKVVALVKANKEKEEALYKWPLVNQLHQIYQDDQHHRQKANAVYNQYGAESNEYTSLQDTIHDLDSINLIQVTEIIDKHGWLGPEVVSKRGNAALFLVIQHANLEVQLQYLPMLREAVVNGKANGSSLALMEDRVALRQGQKQIYGSQIGRNKETGEAYVRPLADPDQVDQRRAAVGLPPLAEYVSRWKIKWDVEAYKKKLPSLEAK